MLRPRQQNRGVKRWPAPLFTALHDGRLESAAEEIASATAGAAPSASVAAAMQR